MGIEDVDIRANGHSQGAAMLDSGKRGGRLQYFDDAGYLDLLNFRFNDYFTLDNAVYFNFLEDNLSIPWCLASCKG